jgi:hypothetical protein
LSLLDRERTGIETRARYTGLQSLFFISEITESGSQIGNIWPVLCESDDLVHWKQPHGMHRSIPELDWSDGMCIPWANPMIDGDNIRVPYFGSKYKHAQFRSHGGRDGIGEAIISKTDWQRLFA